MASSIFINQNNTYSVNSTTHNLPPDPGHNYWQKFTVQQITSKTSTYQNGKTANVGSVLVRWTNEKMQTKLLSIINGN